MTVLSRSLLAGAFALNMLALTRPDPTQLAKAQTAPRPVAKDTTVIAGGDTLILAADLSSCDLRLDQVTRRAGHHRIVDLYYIGKTDAVRKTARLGVAVPDKQVSIRNVIESYTAVSHAGRTLSVTTLHEQGQVVERYAKRNGVFEPRYYKLKDPNRPVAEIAVMTQTFWRGFYGDAKTCPAPPGF